MYVSLVPHAHSLSCALVSSDVYIYSQCSNHPAQRMLPPPNMDRSTIDYDHFSFNLNCLAVPRVSLAEAFLYNCSWVCIYSLVLKWCWQLYWQGESSMAAVYTVNSLTLGRSTFMAGNWIPVILWIWPLGIGDTIGSGSVYDGGEGLGGNGCHEPQCLSIGDNWSYVMEFRCWIMRSEEHESRGMRDCE